MDDSEYKAKIGKNLTIYPGVTVGIGKSGGLTIGDYVFGGLTVWCLELLLRFIINRIYCSEYGGYQGCP